MRADGLIGGAFKLRAVRAAGRWAWQGHTWLPSRSAHRVDSTRLFAQLYADHGYHLDAAEVFRLAAERVSDLSVRVQLDAARVLAELDAGTISDDVDVVQRRVLRFADSALRLGDVTTVAQRLTDALAIAFHPTRHLLDDSSPLLVDTANFLAPLQDSAAMTTLVADAPHPAPDRSRESDTSRLLILVAEHSSMARPLVEEYRAEGREVRFIDVAAVPEAELALADLVAARLEYSLTGARIPVPAPLVEAFDWADTVFVDWGHRALVWASLLNIATPVVTRIHKYEAMTPMPLLTAWQNVGRSIFVASPICDVVAATAPGFGSDVHIIADALDLPHWDHLKRPEAARTLALMGWNKVSKDPNWALDVLEVLHAEDPTWRLLLIGETSPADSGADAYYEALTRRILKFSDAVEVTGFTSDAAQTLTRAGVILSTSRLEGQHDSLIQGVAAGSLPVVRDWRIWPTGEARLRSTRRTGSSPHPSRPPNGSWPPAQRRPKVSKPGPRGSGYNANTTATR